MRELRLHPRNIPQWVQYFLKLLVSTVLQPTTHVIDVVIATVASQMSKLIRNKVDVLMDVFVFQEVEGFLGYGVHCPNYRLQVA